MLVFIAVFTIQAACCGDGWGCEACMVNGAAGNVAAGCKLQVATKLQQRRHPLSTGSNPRPQRHVSIDDLCEFASTQLSQRVKHRSNLLQRG